MRHTVMPEEHDLALGDLLAALDQKFYNIIEMAKQLGMRDGTYLLFCESFLGLRSTFFSQAK